MAPPTGNATFGMMLQTMLYLANFTDHSLNNTLEDFYHLPKGAGIGENEYLFLLEQNIFFINDEAIVSI